MGQPSAETHRWAWRVGAVLAAVVLVTAGVWASQPGSAPAFEVVAAASPPSEAVTTPEPDEAPADTAAASSSSSSQQAATPAADRPEPSKTGSEAEPEPDQSEPDEAAETPGGQTFTYWDGDAQRTVTLVSGDPTVPDSQDPSNRRRSAGDASRVECASGTPEADELVFRAESGVEMTLGHSVVLVVDPDWSDADVRRFLARNRIGFGCVSPMAWLENGFIVETGPGIAALELANALAAQSGVVLASPNWASEAELK